MSRAGGDAAAVRRRHQAAAFAALGDETRLALIATLATGEPRSITALTGGSRLTRQAITKHLRVLEDAGIVRREWRGRESRFAFDPAPLRELEDYLSRVSAQWDEVLARLQSLLES